MAGLVDKSARVRWKAADRAEKLEKVELIPELTAAVAAEKDAKTRGTIEHHLLLLRDGYILEMSAQAPGAGRQGNGSRRPYRSTGAS